MLLAVFLIIGCSGGESGAFKELGVKNSDIPEYSIASRADSEEFEVIAVELEKDSEQEAKKIAADFIENQSNAPAAVILFKVDGSTKYEVKYFENEEAAGQIEDSPNYTEWPVLTFEQVED